ncbi:MAG: ABC transporter permease [Actinobacteria bacterium]|nr:MAG: ABC transporter permease [Actinomycetota bacterium]
MAVEVARAGRPGRRARLRLSAAFWRHPWVKGSALLSPPVLAYLLFYIGALAVLFISAFWTVDSFTGKLVHQWTLANFKTVFSTSDPTYLRIAARTIGIAAAVTVTDAVLAFPLAYYMARLATPRRRALLFVLVLLPLWSSYLVRIYAWRLILLWIVFSYVWLPFMVLPVYAALERIPDNFLEASADLGGSAWRTFRSVVLPLALPGVIAGSIFTFSLTLGDYVTPLLVGGAGSSFIGNVVYENIGINANIPFAAAFATVPLIVMGIYLLIARRLGAFEAL